MKIEAASAVAKVLQEHLPHADDRTPQHRAEAGVEADSPFDETLDPEQRRHASGEREGGRRREAARSRLFLLGQSVELLGERLLGAGLPVLLHAGDDLLWMAQELLGVVQDLPDAQGRMDAGDEAACRAVWTRLRGERGLIERRSGRSSAPALDALFRQLETVLA